MITKLKLKGNELLIFSIIHGFSQDGSSRFTGSISYLNQWTGLDKSTIIAMLKKLVEKKYLNKFEIERNKVKYCEYSSNYFDVIGGLKNPTTPPLPPVEKSNPPRLNNPTPPVEKSDSILIIDNTKGYKETTPPGKNGLLFDEMDNDAKTIFSKSPLKDFKVFEAQFKAPEFKTVDLNYYYQTVSDWSDSKSEKRTIRGWLATTRTIMRRDAGENKLRMIKTEAEINQMQSDALTYLNNFD